VTSCAVVPFELRMLRFQILRWGSHDSLGWLEVVHFRGTADADCAGERQTARVIQRDNAQGPASTRDVLLREIPMTRSSARVRPRRRAVLNATCRWAMAPGPRTSAPRRKPATDRIPERFVRADHEEKRHSCWAEDAQHPGVVDARPGFGTSLARRHKGRKSGGVPLVPVFRSPVVGLVLRQNSPGVQTFGCPVITAPERTGC